MSVKNQKSCVTTTALTLMGVTIALVMKVLSLMKMVTTAQDHKRRHMTTTYQ